MKPLLVLGVAVLAGAAPALAEKIDIAGWQVDPRLEGTIVLAPGRDDAGTTEAEVFATAVRAQLIADRVLDNGAEIGVRLGGALQLDHPARAGFSGQLQDTGLAFLGPAPRGAFSGLTAGGAEEDTGVRAQLETAFIYVDGGYGELLAGRDIGIARRFHEGAPSVFGTHRIATPSLDTSGIATLLTRNDLTGPAAKISYATPRILGVRLGGSYTPRANVSGLDRDPDRNVADVAEPSLSGGLESAINVSRRLRNLGLRIEAYGAYARANLEIGPQNLDQGTVEVWSAGGRMEWERLEIGADWLTSDNGPARYKAWSVGAQINLEWFDLSANYGNSSDATTCTDGDAWSIGLGRELIADRLDIAAGIQRQELEFQDMTSQSSTGPVIEMTLRY